MTVKPGLLMSLLAMFAGVLIMVQLQEEPQQASGESRNIVELRSELVSQQERRQELNRQLEEQLSLMDQLESDDDIEELMVDLQETLRLDAGLTEVSGTGVLIEIDLSFDETYEGGGLTHVPPELLRLLINELNIQGADHIAIDQQRIVSTSAVREVNNRTLVNGQWISYFPVQVKVLTEYPEELRYAMMASNARDMFQYDNMNFTAETVDELTLPAYQQLPRIRHMEVVQEE
ncbi:DUF881 domain-containing protein [Salisediminibacterium beveridgei]|uniref:DUF881 domain-containing protein n=1 Tax=Salisediminibacterium beveridgei TaxID=632773 RepID=A0A1D7QW81_9BACI|nr:DUF881 domain-containing protein [Salisediminibacterium beveridgei]AOM83270.1 hypothetical protein BBEV_1909 [Salisediminibacterium beveridgei]